MSKETKYYTPVTPELRAYLDRHREWLTKNELINLISPGRQTVVSDITLDSILCRIDSMYSIYDYPWYKWAGMFKERDGSKKLFYTPVDISSGIPKILGERVKL